MVILPRCKECKEFFARFRHNPAGECDCPKCQGLCECDLPVKDREGGEWDPDPILFQPPLRSKE